MASCNFFWGSHGCDLGAGGHTVHQCGRDRPTLAEAALRACLAPVGDESREGSAQDVWRALAKEADDRLMALDDVEARLAAARLNVVAARSALLGHQASRLSPRW